MNADHLRSRVLPILLSGTRRDGSDQLLALAPDRAGAVLNAVSLTGQMLRFTRPSPPAQFAVEHWPRDDRRIVPDSLRSPIARLLDRSTDDTGRALALALERRRLRPHPFDLPKLESFVRRYADRLGATAQYWVQRESAAPAQYGYFEAQELTPENWTESPLRPRVQFLKSFRKQQPEAARKLLEQSWPGENPDSRLQLLSTLQHNLSTEDRQFLENIQKDRAPRVRTLVHRLLSTLSGSSAETPALAACMERIQKSKAGLVKKRLALKLELPATVKEHEVNRWIQEQFADLTIETLAQAFQLPGKEFIEAAAMDDNLLFALALITFRDNRIDLLDRITDELPDAWGRMSGLGFNDDLQLDSEDTLEWATALIKPKKWLPDVPFPAWSWLHRQIEGPLPAPLMREILSAKTWTEHLEPEKKGGAEFIQAICALCPPELRGTMRVQLEPLEIDRKDKGRMLLDILDELEALL
jgi:hypothetical protein